VGEESRPDDSARPVTTLRIGDASSFGDNQWWSNRDWHQLVADGFGADVACDAGTVGELAIAAISVRGHKHRVDGLPNEDSFAIRVAKSKVGEEFVVLVLCDGLSSATHSAFAARRTSSLVADMLRRIIADDAFTMQALSYGLSQCLREFVVPELTTWSSPATALSLPAYGVPSVESSNVQPSELLVTLTIAIVPTTNGEKGASDVLLGTIGDSPAYVLLKNGDWLKPSYGEQDDGVLTTATAAFPKTTDIAVTQIILYEGDCLCLMSDGVGNFIQNKSGQLRLGKHLAEVWLTPRDIPTLVRDVSFDLRSADDDRTVILCWTDREAEDTEITDETEVS